MKTDRSIEEMVDDGVPWNDIAEEKDITVSEAMQEYREEAYDYWDTGWSMTVEDCTYHMDTDFIGVWIEEPHELIIEELYETIPLIISADVDDYEMSVKAGLTPDEARQLARTLEECADIIEGEK